MAYFQRHIADGIATNTTIDAHQTTRGNIFPQKQDRQAVSPSLRSPACHPADRYRSAPDFEAAEKPSILPE